MSLFPLRVLHGFMHPEKLPRHFDWMQHTLLSPARCTAGLGRGRRRHAERRVPGQSRRVLYSTQKQRKEKAFLLSPVEASQNPPRRNSGQTWISEEQKCSHPYFFSVLHGFLHDTPFFSFLFKRAAASIIIRRIAGHAGRVGMLMGPGVR